MRGGLDPARPPRAIAGRSRLAAPDEPSPDLLGLGRCREVRWPLSDLHRESSRRRREERIFPGLHATLEADGFTAGALAAKLLFPPGTRFQYNNGAVDFLSVVVKQAAGIPLDEYLDQHLFRKIDAVGVHWWKDPEGAPHGAGELFIRPVDLAKIGQMMLDDGKWKGEEIVPADWVRQSVQAGQPFEEDCGLLWRREGAFAPVVNEAVLAGFRDLGIDEKNLSRMRGLVGKRFRRPL
jgi:CubicO group peptidase (beta-lactamase class C family)